MHGARDNRTAAQGGVWTATGHERPVFLDEHGRRRRWVFAGGGLAGGLSALWLGALVTGAIGFSTLPVVGSIHHAARLLRVISAGVRVPVQDRDRLARAPDIDRRPARPKRT